jgi:hypothetical protein
MFTTPIFIYVYDYFTPACKKPEHMNRKNCEKGLNCIIVHNDKESVKPHSNACSAISEKLTEVVISCSPICPNGLSLALC